MKKMFEEHSQSEGYAWHVDRDDAGRRRIHKGGQDLNREIAKIALAKN